MKTTIQPKPKAYVEESGTPPPAVVTVEHERVPVLHLPDGRVLVRKAGF